jgi:hypothetical protein
MTTGPIPVPSLPVSDRLTSSLPADPKEIMRRGQDVAKALKVFVKRNPCQVHEGDSGSKFLRVESWQFVAACYGCTPMISSTQALIEEGSNKELGFIAVAHLRNDQGQIISGAEATCMCEEEFWQGQPLFAVRSMASTRASAKVIRLVFGWVVQLAGFQPTPAEEIERGQAQSHSQMTGKKCHECGNQVSDKKWNDTRRKYGKALCLEHEKIEKQGRANQVIQPINDPKFVEESVKRVQSKVEEKKASQGQPVVSLLDLAKDSYSL